MAKIVELAPDGTLESTGWIIQAGNGAGVPATIHAALADELPPGNTNIDFLPWTLTLDQQAVIGGDLRGTFGTYTLEATERCRRVRLHAIGYVAACRHRIYLGNGASNTETQGVFEFRGPNFIVESNYGPWSRKAMDASGFPNLEWTQTPINDLRYKAKVATSHFLGTMALYYIRAQLDIVEKPASLVEIPYADQVFPNVHPTFRWSHYVPEPQKKVHLRIFRDEVAEGNLFDPATSTQTIYSYQSSGTTEMSHQVVDFNYPNRPPVEFLKHGERYYVYVRTAVDFNGEDWWSDWSPGVPFRINSKPTVTVTAPPDPVVDTARPVISWTYTDEEGDLQAAARVIILKKPPLGWPGIVDPEAEVLAGNAIHDSGVMATELTDYELPVALLNGGTYRAYVKVRERVPNVLESDWAFKAFTLAFASPLAPSLAVMDIQAKTAIDVKLIPSLSNLLTAAQSSMEGGVDTWIAGTDTTVTSSAAQFLHGANSIQIQKTVSTGTAEAFSDATTGGIGVAEGKPYSAIAWVKAGTVARQARLDLQILNAANAVIDTVLGVVVEDNTTGWTKLFVNDASVAAGGVRARLRVHVSGAAAGENHFLDQAMIYIGSSDEIPWDLGGGTLGVTLSPDSAVKTKIRNWLTEDQASLESSTTGWAAVSGTTISRSSAQAKNGTWSLTIQRTSTTGDARAITAEGDVAIPVTPGEEITFIASYRAATTGRTCFNEFVYYDSVGGLIAGTPDYLEQQFVADNTSGWVTIKTRANVPSNAWFVAVRLNAQAALTGEVHYVDEMILYKGDTTVWSIGDAKTLHGIDLQILLGVTLLDWLPEDSVCLAHRWDFVNGQQSSWALWLLADGKLRFDWSSDGTDALKKSATSTAGVSLAAGTLNWIKLQFDSDNGAGGQSVSFFHGTTKAGATTAIGTNPVIVSNVDPIYNGYADLQINGLGFVDGGWQGYATEIEIRNSATGAGLVRTNGIFNLPSATEWRDSFNRLWEAINGAEMEIKEEPNPDFFYVERSRDGGLTWEVFRYDDGLLSNRIEPSTSSFTFRDHEVPLNVPVQYRGQAITIGLGYDANSVSSAVATATVVGSYVSLKDTRDPSKNRTFRVADKWLETVRTRNRQMFQPVGRRNPIVIRGHGLAETFRITFTLFGSDADALSAILDADNLIFVQTPKGSWWVEVASDIGFRAHLWDRMRGEEDAFQLSVPFQEVDRLDQNVVASIT